MENKEKSQKIKEVFADKTKLKNTIIMIGIIIFVVVFAIYILDKQGVINSEKLEENRQSSTVSKDLRLSKQITPSDYGKSINYSIDLDGNENTYDWRVFYNDGTHIFLIVNDYFPSRLVNSELTGLYPTEFDDYRVRWNQEVNFQEISETDLKLFRTTKYKLNSKCENSCYMSILLNPNNWTNLVDKEVAYKAIGSPTIEMFTESWNSKYDNIPILYKAYYTEGVEYPYGYGYYLAGKSNKPSHTYKCVKSEEKAEMLSDELYFPYTNKEVVLKSYTLSSPTDKVYS